MQCSFLSLSDLTPTEGTDPHHVREVHHRILSIGYWTTPIWVEKNELFIMDGHHRLAVANLLGLQFIPAVLTDYDTVHVEAWRPGETITAGDIYAMARSGQKFPIKTTRHRFPGEPPQCHVPLGELGHRHQVRSLDGLKQRAS